ncbi:hypothetical protein OS035_12230 [Rhizobium sp. 268]|uniref:hypothetical protein n=1 Tax=Rhizobium sp. 268 TaxID=2996375 RepID=UPI002F926326
MYRKYYCVAAITGLATALNTCAIPPDVRDFAHVDTYDITRRVRCEMRDAVRQKAKEAIARRQPEIAAKLVTDEDFLKFDFATLGRDAQSIVNVYKDTLIGYDWNFDITERNDVTAGADVLNTFTRGTFGIGTSITNNRERNNVETFRELDSFVKLATMVSNADYCKPDVYKPKNYMYPITGNLNLISYVKKYLDHNQSGNLAGAEGSKDLATYSIKLKFTTMWNSKLTPDLDLPTRGLTWELVGVDGSAENTRTDVHQVSIVMVLPAGGDQRSLTIAEERVRAELEYLRLRDDLRSFANH